jgi:hypothetical protein
MTIALPEKIGRYISKYFYRVDGEFSYWFSGWGKCAVKTGKVGVLFPAFGG